MVREITDDVVALLLQVCKFALKVLVLVFEIFVLFQEAYACVAGHASDFVAVGHDGDQSVGSLGKVEKQW